MEKEASSDGTQKVVGVQQCVSVREQSDRKVEKGSHLGREGGVALAKQEATREAATCL